MKLPSNRIRSRWVRVEEFPEGRRIGKRSMVIDQCYRDGKPHQIHVAYVADHPFLKHLEAMGDAPRQVKAIYKASVRLAHKTTTEAIPVIQQINAAHDAWDAYLQRVEA